MYIPKKTISSMVTSFKNDVEVDLEGLVENLEFQKKSGIESVCILGGTGEAASLSQSERHRIMETTMENSEGLDVVFGALAGTPDDVKADIVKAKELNANAVMVMATPFVMPAERDVELYFTELASLGMPLILFNTPGRSSFSMSSSLIVRLSELDGIIGIKEASADMFLLQDIIQNCKQPFEVITGLETLYLPSLVLGARGSLVGAAAVIPEAFVELDNAFMQGNIEKARKIHYIVKVLEKVLYKASHPVPLKRTLELRGLPAGKCRAPFTDLDNKHEEEIHIAMKQIKEMSEGIIEFNPDYSF